VVKVLHSKPFLVMEVPCQIDGMLLVFDSLGFPALFIEVCVVEALASPFRALSFLI